MTRKLVVGLFGVAAVTAALATRGLSQDEAKKPDAKAEAEKKDDAKKPSSQPGAAEMDAAMKLAMKMLDPVENRKILGHMVGDWGVAIKLFGGGPGAPPMESKGSSVVKWMLDGQCVQEDFTATLSAPDADGKMHDMVFKGLGLEAYDPIRNMFTGVWVDTLTGQIQTMKGTRNESGDTLTFYGEMDEPSLRVFGRIVKYVHRFVDKDRHVFEIYDLHAGEDFKVMEISYTRKK